MDKSIGALKQTILAHALALPYENSVVAAYRDRASGLEYLRRVTDIHHDGITLDLRGFQYVALMDWRILQSSSDQPWDALSDSLGGRGVHSVNEALSMLRLRHVHEALSHAVSPRNIQIFAKLGVESVARIGEAQPSETSGEDVLGEPGPAKNSPPFPWG